MTIANQYNALSDPELFEKVRHSSSEEHRITREVLELLREVSHRRLFARYGYESLFTFLVRELRYDEASAYRRMNAVRLMEALPEVEQALEEGRLSVATASQAQSFFQQAKRRTVPCSLEKKREILKKLEGCSKREVERVLAQESPQAPKPDQTCVINESQTEIRFTADQELMDLLKEVERLTAHRANEGGYNGLLKLIAKEVLKRLDPARNVRVRAKKLLSPEKVSGEQRAPSLVQEQTPHSLGKVNQERKPPSPGRVAPDLERTSSNTGEVSQDGKMSPSSPSRKASLVTRAIPAPLKREIWKRDGGRCTYASPLTGRRCESRQGLQYEHILPWALGGETSEENLTLHCLTHNRERAYQAYGPKTVERYLGEYSTAAKIQPSISPGDTPPRV